MNSRIAPAFSLDLEFWTNAAAAAVAHSHPVTFLTNASSAPSFLTSTSPHSRPPMKPPRQDKEWQDVNIFVMASGDSNDSDRPDGFRSGHDVERAEPPRTAPSDYPEGGWRAWSVVAGVWLAQFCTFGYTNAYGVYNDFYVREYLNEKYTSSQISWIGSIQLLLTLSCGLVSGRLYDTGHFYHLMIGGLVLYVFCLFMVSLSRPEQYYQIFLAHGLGLGSALGITYVPSLAVVTQYFNRRRAFAIGIAASGSALGATVHPIMLNNLFHGPVGFHNGVRASAGLIAGLLLISVCLMRTRFPPGPPKESSLWSDFRHYLRDPAYLILTFGTFLNYAGLYIPTFFLQLKAIKNGLPPHFAFYTLVVLNGVSIAGRVVPNMMVARYGVFNVTIACISICGVLAFCFIVIDTIPGTTVFAVLYGFFSGGYASLLTPLVGSMAEKDSEIGSRLGICFTLTGFGGLIGSPIAGALLSSSFIWWRPVLFSGICVLCGAACLSITRFLLVKKKGTWRV